MPTPVTILDTNLEQFLLHQLVEQSIIPTATTPLNQEDLQRLQGDLTYDGTSLSNDKKITDLNGIEYCTQVLSFNFMNNLISVFPPTFNSTQLNTLLLDNNQLTALPNFSGLTALQLLSISNNKISNLNEFNQLPSSLKTLDLSSNPIQNLPGISLFQRLPNLFNFWAKKCKLTDISSLAGLQNQIGQLLLDENNITDLTPLQNLTSLTTLDLTLNQQLQNIAPLGNLTNLTHLSIADTQISEVKALKGLTNMIELRLHQNQISSIDGLENMSELTLLTLARNAIRDISPLKDKEGLVDITLDYNQITDFSPLKDSPLTTWFSATNQIAHLPNVILHAYRLILPNPVKDQHGNSIPPQSEQWLFYNETEDTLSWDNCYGWGNQTFHFHGEDDKISGEVHLFYQTFKIQPLSF